MSLPLYSASGLEKCYTVAQIPLHRLNTDRKKKAGTFLEHFPMTTNHDPLSFSLGIESVKPEFSENVALF